MELWVVEMSGELRKEIEEAVSAVERCIADHQSGGDPPFSAKFLVQVRDELRIMADDPEYQPKYPRFVLDWPDETGLKAALMDLAYRFNRLRGKR